MTDQEINIAIAEACGWIDVVACEDGTAVGLPPGFTEDQCPEGADEVIPSYCTDLNAMHDAVMAQAEKLRMSINDKLMNLLNPEAPMLLDRTINAIARQRAEAFLRTLNLWKPN